MKPWEALVLGAVQGFTEFFPVSSDGHLVLTEELLGLNLPGVSFDVALHVATLISVILVFRTKLIALVIGVVNRSTWGYIAKLALATVPAAIAGLLFKDWFEARFDDPRFAGTMLFVTGAVVWSSRWALGAGRAIALEILPLVVVAGVSLWAGTLVPFLAVLAVEAAIMVVSRVIASRQALKEPTWDAALLMGLAQAVAILPGVSRSAGTVVSGLWKRVDPVAAAEFSFLMSIPAILGAAVLSLPGLMSDGALTTDATSLALGMLAAGICGVLAIRFFIVMLQRRSFWGFAVYCWIAGTLFLLLR